MIGTVKWFDPVKGFGFIIPDEGGPDVFFHGNTIERAHRGIGFIEGDAIEYEPRRVKGRDRAVWCRHV